MMKKVKALGADKDIIFLGEVTDFELSCLYSGATAFIFGSFSEGFGFPPLEAMASNCPVISSSATAMSETVADSGILVEPNNIAGFTEALHSLAISEELRHSLKEKGYNRAREFSWDKCAKEHLQVYYD